MQITFNNVSGRCCIATSSWPLVSCGGSIVPECWDGGIFIVYIFYQETGIERDIPF